MKTTTKRGKGKEGEDVGVKKRKPKLARKNNEDEAYEKFKAKTQIKLPPPTRNVFVESLLEAENTMLESQDVLFCRLAEDGSNYATPIILDKGKGIGMERERLSASLNEQRLQASS